MIALVLALTACEPKEEDTLDLRDPPDDLVIPDLTGVDLVAVYQDALRLAIATDTRVAWDAHTDSLFTAEPGCPDFFAGTPDLENDDIDEDATGWSWADHCSTPGDRVWGGFGYFENSVFVDGDSGTLEGATTEGTRTLIADGIMALAGEVQMEFDGEASDSLLLVEADGYSHWVYASRLDGTVTGEMAFPTGSDLEGGYRADMYVQAAGGDTNTLEIRGDVHYFDALLHDRFDSLTVDLAYGDEASLSPDDCKLEPKGWIGVRDQNAFWYDLVFQPRYDDDPTDVPYPDVPYGECDGCGTMFIRGLEQGTEVCPDLSFLWDGALTHPVGADYALTLRQVLAGDTP